MSLSHLALDAFQSIAEVGTILEASKSLGVTQTALTQRIKLLEEDLGVSLFIRSRKGMVLTEKGETLYRYCQERSRNENHVVQQIKGLGELKSLSVRLAGPTFQLRRRIKKLVEKTKKSDLKILFDINFDDSNDLTAFLKTGKTDFILTSIEPPPSFQAKKLSSSEFVIAIPYGWRKRTIEDIVSHESIIDFSKDDLYTLNFLKSKKILPKYLPPRHFINNTFQMLEMVEEGHGYAVFDKRDLEAKLKEKKLALLGGGQLSVDQVWYLCWSNTGSITPENYTVIINSFT